MSRVGSTLWGVVNYRNEISHQLTRRHVLQMFREGLITRDSVCDADFLLITAGRYHGHPSTYPCPVCGGMNLRTVLWVYGEDIGKASGSARNEEEIAKLVDGGRECTVHTVEVCPDCRWNHLLKAVTAVAR